MTDVRNLNIIRGIRDEIAWHEAVSEDGTSQQLK